MITIDDFIRINNDTNGNPRYVCHFLAFNKPDDLADYSGIDRITRKYNLALLRARALGGRKFHNRQYGGGIAFQSYNIQSLCDDVNKLMAQVNNGV